MTRLADLPIMELILAAEEKHGTEVNMVIEAQPKNSSTDESDDEDSTGMEAEDTDVIWYVEFKDTKKYLNNFEEVKKFFLEEADQDPSKLVIPVTSVSVEEE